MKKILSALGVILLALAAACIYAGPAQAASDDPTPYTVGEHGITLPDGQVFQDNGHVNVKTNQGDKGIHFESLNNQPSGKYIGQNFLPYDAFGYDVLSLCVNWVQLSQYNEHFGEGGQAPVGKGCATVTPTPDPTPTETPTPEPTPTETATPTPTPKPSETPTEPVEPESSEPPTVTPVPEPVPVETAAPVVVPVTILECSDLTFDEAQLAVVSHPELDGDGDGIACDPPVQAKELAATGIDARVGVGLAFLFAILTLIFGAMFLMTKGSQRG